MKKVLQQGFTLMELLVSIAVLAIIVAIVIVGINPVKRINAAKDTVAKTDVGSIVNALQRHYSNIENPEKYTYPQKLEDLQGNEIKTIPKQQAGAYDCSGNPTTAETQDYCYAVNTQGTAAALWGTTWGEAETAATASAGTTPAATTARAYYWCWDSTTGAYKALTESPTTVPTADDPVCPVAAVPTRTPTPTSILAILTPTSILSPTPTTDISNLTPTPTIESPPGPPFNPTSLPSPTAVPCQVEATLSTIDLGIGETGIVTAAVSSGLGEATVTQMRFGSYNTSIATVNPASDSSSPYSTAVTALTTGTTAVWATADLSDGRVCQSTGTTDTDINVFLPTPTPTAIPPTCTSAGPDNVVESAATHTVYAYGVENATSVTFPTWSDINDQDDVVWYPGSNLGNGTWTATIPHSSHRSGNLDWGQFNTYAYLSNVNYEYILCDTANFTWVAPTPTLTPTPIPCSTSTSPSAINLVTGGTAGTVTTTVTGLSTATVTQMRFGSYNTGIATVNPTSDSSSPYSTTVTALTTGNTAVWATADLSDGRFCQSSGTTDTDINVVNPTSTPTPIPTNTPTPTNTPIPTPTRTPTPTPTSTPTPTPTRTPTPTPSLQSPATFYATSNDGFIAAFSNVYLTAHNATTGTVYNNYYIYVGQVHNSSNYQIYRSGLFFDTSALPDNATITSAKVSLYLPSGYDLSVTDFVLDLVWGGFLDNPLVAADYSDLPKGGPTGLVLGSINTSGLIEEGWNDISVSCCSPFSGTAWISKTGITQFGLMSSRDVNSNAPTGNEYVVFRDYDRGSTSTGPRLIISFTIP